MKLSDLKEGQSFKLATSDNTCVFKGAYLEDNQVRVTYKYECVNSGNAIETYNNYEVFEGNFNNDGTEMTIEQIGFLNHLKYYNKQH